MHGSTFKVYVDVVITKNIIAMDQKTGGVKKVSMGVRDRRRLSTRERVPDEIRII